MIEDPPRSEIFEHPAPRSVPVPRILHQTWKSKIEIGEQFKFWRNSFFECNPGITGELYGDDDNRRLVEEFIPSLIEVYDSFPREIFRADFIRPVYMFFYGGLYADLDFQCLKPLYEIFSAKNTIILGTMGSDQGFANNIPNAMMASSPYQGFWLGYLRNIELAWTEIRKRCAPDPNPVHVTGPVILKRTVSEYHENLDLFKANTLSFIENHNIRFRDATLFFDELVLLPPHAWYPLNWNHEIDRAFKNAILKSNRRYSIEEARKRFPTSSAVTYWAHTW